MMLSGSTLAILASSLLGMAAAAAATENSVGLPRNASPSFAPAIPAARRITPPSVSRPHPASLPLFAKPFAPGLPRSAATPAAETRGKVLLVPPVVRPSGRTAARVSAAMRLPARIWHRAGGVATPTAAEVAARSITPPVYRPGHASSLRNVAPAGLNRFVSTRHATPTMPSQPGSAPLDPR